MAASAALAAVLEKIEIAPAFMNPTADTMAVALAADTLTVMTKLSPVGVDGRPEIAVVLPVPIVFMFIWPKM